MKKETLFKEYKLAINEIKLRKAYVTSFEVKKIDDVIVHEGSKVDIDISKKVELIKEQEGAAYLKVDINVNNSNEENIAKISAIYKGIFYTEKKLEEKVFLDNIDLIAVSQLIPYARVLISNFSVMIGIPPIYIPTIDILSSISANSGKKE